MLDASMLKTVSKAMHTSGHRPRMRTGQVA